MRTHRPWRRGKRRPAHRWRRTPSTSCSARSPPPRSPSSSARRWAGRSAPRDFGLYFLISSFATFAYVVVDWGQQFYVIREVARTPSRGGDLLGDARWGCAARRRPRRNPRRAPHLGARLRRADLLVHRRLHAGDAAVLPRPGLLLRLPRARPHGAGRGHLGGEQERGPGARAGRAGAWAPACGGVVFAQALGGARRCSSPRGSTGGSPTGPVRPAGRPPGSCSRAAPASSA